MRSMLALFVAFVLGGVLLVPICLAVLAGFLFYTSPAVPTLKSGPLPTPITTTLAADDIEPIKVYRAGWLTVRRTYEAETGGGDGTYVSMMVSGYRSFMDNRSRDPRRSKPKDHFFAVLKQNVLFLYDTEEQVDCWAAVEVTLHQVIIYPEELIDGELFVKRNAICLRPYPGVEQQITKPAEPQVEKEGGEKDAGEKDDQAQLVERTDDHGRPLPWFIFAEVNSDKEDWYHSFVQASKLGAPVATTDKDRALFDRDDMARLIEGIDSQPESIPVRWLNALIGRIFLAVYRTESLQASITAKIVKKLSRVKTPSILSEIKVREVNVGSAVPFFSKPMLKELTAEGDASIELHVNYVGDLRMTIETVATINLGSRFKPYSVRLVLAIVLKEMEGTLLVKVKPPPSNRLWVGFTTMPRMVLSVEPVVSTRQIKWSMITSPIESRIREVIMDSIVLPHMDDFPFFDSRPFLHRGGIFAEALRNELNLTEEHHEEETTAPETLISNAPEVGGVSESMRQRGRPRRSSDGDLNEYSSPLKDKEDTASIKSSKIASSPSSLAGFSLSAWTSRESKLRDKDATTEKRKSWFSPARSSSPSSRSAPSTPGKVLDGEGAAQESESDVASARLRDILNRRAAAGEVERTPLTIVPGEPQTSVLLPSALSLTAPTVPAAQPRPASVHASSPIVASIPSASSSVSLPQLDTTVIKLSAAIDIVQPIIAPELPHRPSFRSTPPSASTLPPPPPRRAAAHTASSSTSSTTSASAAALINTWRTKATDKEALAAGVAQAKDSLKRWGATWQNARAKAGGENNFHDSEGVEGSDDRRMSMGSASRIPVPVNGGSAPMTISSSSSSSSRTRSNSQSQAGHFIPAPSPPTTRLSTFAAASSPPLDGIAGGGTRTYARQNKMAIPGIRDTLQKIAVAEDHAGSSSPVSVAPSTTTPASFRIPVPSTPIVVPAATPVLPETIAGPIVTTAEAVTAVAVVGEVVAEPVTGVQNLPEQVGGLHTAVPPPLPARAEEVFVPEVVKKTSEDRENVV